MNNKEKEKYEKINMTFTKALSHEQEEIMIASFQTILESTKEHFRSRARSMDSVLFRLAANKEQRDIMKNSLLFIEKNIYEYIKLNKENDFTYHLSIRQSGFEALNLDLFGKQINFGKILTERLTTYLKNIICPRLKIKENDVQIVSYEIHSLNNNELKEKNESIDQL